MLALILLTCFVVLLTMLKIFIDSTEFKSEPSRLSKSFGQTTELSILDFLQIHLSKINVDEIESWIDETISKNKHSSLDALNKTKYFKLSEEQFESNKKLMSETTQWYDSAKEDAKTEFKSWLKKTKSVIHHIEPEDGSTVMGSYFSGTPPFKQIKYRDDIPDAFIWETLKRFNLQEGQLYFVSADNNFRSKVNTNFGNLKCFDTLKILFEQPEMLELVKSWESFTRKAFTDALIEMIEAELKIQKKYLESDFIRKVEDNLIGNKYSLQGGRYIGEISEVRFVERPEIIVDYVQVAESTKLYLTFDSEVEFTIYVLVPIKDKGNATNLNDLDFFDNIISYGENTTDTHFSAEEYKMARIYGELFIELPKLNSGSGKEDVIQAIEDCEIKISNLKIEGFNY